MIDFDKFLGIELTADEIRSVFYDKWVLAEVTGITATHGLLAKPFFYCDDEMEMHQEFRAKRCELLEMAQIAGLSYDRSRISLGAFGENWHSLEG